MAVELDIVAGMLALERGQAVPIATHQQVAVHPAAHVLSFLAMAGEDTSMHAVCFGPVGAPMEDCLRFSVPDPRNRDHQMILYGQLADRLLLWFDAHRAGDGDYPQLWVSSGAAAMHLDAVAERLRYVRIPDDADGRTRHRLAQVRRLGESLTWFADRWRSPGQQTLMVATDVLRRHWATGQQPGEDEHLGALLTWLRGAPPGEIHARVAEAELQPMGCTPRPEFDEALGPLVTSYNKALRNGAQVAELKQQASPIHDALARVVTNIHAATNEAAAHLVAAELPQLPALDDLEDIERSAFTFFMRGRDGGYGIRKRDSAKQGAFGLVERESSEENEAAACLMHDGVARARAVLTGHLVVGEVVEVRREKVPRKTVHRLALVSDQPQLRVRPGDTLHWHADTRLAVVVQQVANEGDRTRLDVQVVKGMRKVQMPVVGDLLELGGEGPRWFWLHKSRKQLSERLAEPAWTHDDQAMPPARPRTDAPTDPLQAIEDLR